MSEVSAEAAATQLLRQLGEEAGPVLPIAEAALALAVLERPGIDPAPYLAHLTSLALAVGRIAGRVEPDLEHMIASLRRGIVWEAGYLGDDKTFDDVVNANLMHVIDRRRGLPVSLAILFLHAARAQGWMAQGLNFPGHFMIRLEYGGLRAIIDPFSGGEPRDAAMLRRMLRQMDPVNGALHPSHYAAISDRDVLLRLQDNIKVRRLRDGKLLEALAVIDRMLLLAPRRAELWRESALVNDRLDRPSAALAAAALAVTYAETSQQRHQAALLHQQLQSRLN